MTETLTLKTTEVAQADAADMRALTPGELDAASGAKPFEITIFGHYFAFHGNGVIEYCNPNNQCKLILL
ncbi:MAG TPA: hypothetical protein VFO36_07015 [Nitrospiraceae bacterium]|jgi:hypothetical protein|nr:hypothetical protein [Nitrospiraceae bacterium]